MHPLFRCRRLARCVGGVDSLLWGMLRTCFLGINLNLTVPLLGGVGGLGGVWADCYHFWACAGCAAFFWAVSAAWAHFWVRAARAAIAFGTCHFWERPAAFGPCPLRGRCGNLPVWAAHMSKQFNTQPKEQFFLGRAAFAFGFRDFCHTFGMCRFWAVSAAWAHFLVRAALAFWDVPLLGGVSGLGGVWAAWAPFWVCSALAFWDVPLLGGDAPHLPLLGLAFFIIIEHTQCKLPPIIWEHVGPGIAPHLPHLGLAFLGCAAFAFGF